MRVLKDNEGKESIKRWLIIILVAFSLTAATVDQFTEYKANNTLITAFFSGSMLLVTGTVVEKFRNRR